MRDSARHDAASAREPILMQAVSAGRQPPQHGAGPTWLPQAWQAGPGRLPDAPWKRYAAQAYARRGWHVFPVTPGGKTPLTRTGFKEATTDDARIRDWWERWPDANIGVATGASGLFVVDVDVADGKPGMTGLAALAERGLPESICVCTGSGGLHIYYGGTGRSSAGRLGKGIDTRGRGGYVVAPPSTHPRGWYWWISNEDRKPAQAPRWLLDAAVDRDAEERQKLLAATAHYGGESLVGSSRYSRAVLAGACEDVARAGEGRRNAVLFSRASKLRRHVANGELEASETVRALTAAAQRSGLGAREAARAIRNGLHHGGAA